MYRELLPIFFLLLPQSLLAQADQAEDSIAELTKQRCLLLNRFLEVNQLNVVDESLKIVEQIGAVERKLVKLLEADKSQPARDARRQLIDCVY